VPVVWQTQVPFLRFEEGLVVKEPTSTVFVFRRGARRGCWGVFVVLAGWVDEAGVVGGDDELDAVACAEFHEQAADVGFDGGLADVQAGCDLGVGVAEADEGQDLAFALGDLFQGCGWLGGGVRGGW
jgi:hypothetical protein